jgi:hypothetical protein
MQTITKPGIYNISNEEYHKDPCPEPALTRSGIKDILYKSPLHAWHNNPRLNPNFKRDDGNGKFDPGTVSHDLLLEGLYRCAIIDAEDWRTKAAQETRKIARLEGKTPLLKHQYEEASLMVKAAESQIYGCKELGITNLKAEGDAEWSYIWQEDGLWLKVRPDWISKDRALILDYKTTGMSANPLDLPRHIIAMSYDIQSVLYQRGVNAVEKTDPRFIFIFQETAEPYLCSFIELPELLIDMGKQKVENGIFLWKECMATGNWFGYPNKVMKVEAPQWAMNDWLYRNQKIGVEEE